MSSKLAVWLAVMAWPAASVAQTLTITNPVLTSSTSFTFRSSQCADTVALQWTYVFGTFTQNTTTGMRLWATAGTCGGLPDAGDVTLADDVPLATLVSRKQDTFSVMLSNLPIFSATDGGVSCGDANKEVPAYICAATTYVYGTSGSNQYTQGSFKVVYDTKPPAAPQNPSCSPQDGALVCSYTVGSDAVSVTATARADGVDVSSASGTPTSGSGSVRIKGLTNGVSYTVGFKAYDAAGNESIEASSDAVVPVRTEGFFGLLRDAGSTEEGNFGCSMAGPVSGRGSGGEQGLTVFLLPFATLALVRILARRGGR